LEQLVEMSGRSGADTVSELTECLQTHAPRVLDFPGDLAHPPDPVAWALDLFAANITQADMQSMEPGPGNQDPKLTYFDQRDPASFERFRLRIQNAQPVHGSLVLVDYCSGRGTVRDDADWAWQVFNDQFAAGLARCHPLGSYLKSNLWMSCGDHVYQAHCDLADGFLFHMRGRKRVRVWPVPQKYRRKLIFNHADFKGRMASEPIDFELEPGQILFIPSGAMHEVVAHGGPAAVSVSFHMGSPFPVLTLCAQLNRMVRGGEVTVPPYMKKTDKFNLYFFEPSHFTREAGGPPDDMPAELLKELAGVLQSKQIDAQTMRRLLSNWWRLASSRPLYQGPYPERA
jgi:hypothetical protein